MASIVSVEQISAMLDFLEVNTELALGYINRSKEGRCTAKRLWEQCAATLNGISTNCLQKTPDQWRTYYNEYKSKLMKKISSVKAGITGTGGGPSKKINFTPYQERLKTILGEDVGEPLEGVRHNPLSQSEQVMEQDPIDPGTSQDSDIFLTPINEDDINDSNLALPETSISLPESSRPATCPLSSSRPTEPAAPQRRRRRRRQRSPHQQESNDPVSNMNLATERLEAIENLSVEAIKEHLQAVHRLAAAFEKIADHMGVLLSDQQQFQPQSKRFRRIIYSSESDEE